MDPPSPSHSHTLTSHNLTFFNDLASTYDIHPWQTKVHQQITAYIQQNLDFIGIPKYTDTNNDNKNNDDHDDENSNNKNKNYDNDNTTDIKLLDYACGTGTISRALGPSVTSIKAIDLSPNMIARYNELASTSSIPSVLHAQAIVGNLLTDEDNPPPIELNGPDFQNFSIIAIGAGLHHFPSPAEAISRLAERLRVGGVLLIFDFVEEEEGWKEVPTGAEHTIHKHGFGEGEVRGLMEGGGLAGFGWREMSERLEIRVQEEKPIWRKGFLARGTKM